MSGWGTLEAGAQPLAEGELRSPHPEDVNRTKGRIHSSWKSAACWRVRCSHVIMTADASRELATVIKRSPAHVFNYPRDRQEYKYKFIARDKGIYIRLSGNSFLICCRTRFLCQPIFCRAFSKFTLAGEQKRRPQFLATAQRRRSSGQRF